MVNLQTVDGLVTWKGLDFYLLSTTRHSSDQTVFVHQNFCPQGENLLGKWISVKIDGRFRAYEDIADMGTQFETRIDHRGFPQFKVQLHHRGRFEDRYEIYFNETVGEVIEPHVVINPLRKNAWYYVWIWKKKAGNGKYYWLIAHENEGSVAPIDGPAKPFKGLEAISDSLRIVKGIVLWDERDSKQLIAWSPSIPDAQFVISCENQESSSQRLPAEMNMLGKWVEMTVDDSGVVQEPINVIQDCFETHNNEGKIEILINMQNVESSDSRYEVFQNDTFGQIIAEKSELKAIFKRDFWYTAWIVSHRESDKKTNWTLAANRTILGPFSVNFGDQKSEVDEANTSENLSGWEGIVIEEKHGAGFMATGIGPHNSKIYVGYEFCPNIDMIGRWIKMRVGTKTQVREPIVLIPDVFPTRLNNKGNPEILADFHCISIKKRPMFVNEVLGITIDPSLLTLPIEYGEWYRAWITRELQSGKSKYYWNLAKYDDVEGPLTTQEQFFRNNRSRSRQRSPHRSSDGRDQFSGSVDSQFPHDHWTREPSWGRSSRSPPRDHRHFSVSRDRRFEKSRSPSHYRDDRADSPHHNVHPQSMQRFSGRPQEDPMYPAPSKEPHGQSSSSRFGPASTQQVTSQNQLYKPWNPHAKAQKIRENMMKAAQKNTSSVPMNTGSSRQEPSWETREEFNRLQMDLSEIVRIVDFYTSHPEINAVLEKADRDAYEQLQRELKTARNKVLS